jgi:fermentation-respiration switch protein FrsA (DUF1100 family)
MRKDVAFTSKGLNCRAWLYLPDDLPPDEKRPVVVMAHGFSGVKEMFLDKFAERFVGAGLTALVFDFRNLGESEGEPRGQVFPHEQHEDYRNAVTWVSRQPMIDAERIGVWGTSYSGGHVLHLGAFDRRIKAVVAQVPAVSVWGQIVRTGGNAALHGLLAIVTADRIARYEGGKGGVLKVVGAPGEPCVLGTPDAYEFFQKTGTDRAPTWQNAVTLESLERMIEYDPVDAIELVSPTPLLLIAAEQDSLISIDAVREAFGRAGDPKRLEVLECGHFDVYDSEPWFSRAADAATGWFREHLA